nr:protein FAR1-RELATED SEQUENCE 5-like [Ipomoea batatas]
MHPGMFEDIQGNVGEACKVQICLETNDEFIPECDGSIKPYLGQRFRTVDEGVQFYKQYVATDELNITEYYSSTANVDEKLTARKKGRETVEETGAVSRKTEVGRKKNRRKLKKEYES